MDDRITFSCYEAVKLWELPAEVFLQAGMEGLLPLVTLTHDGKRREVVDEMITRLVASHNHNLLSMAFNFAALVYDKPDEHAWLIERFEMYKKDLEESWVYQRTLGEGREEGREEGEAALRETLVGFLNARYPMLVELAREQINGITEIKQLQKILKRPCIVYNSDGYLELADTTDCLCPDVSVSCDRRDRHAVKVIHYPCVVAEVLSSGTKARDRGIKSELYQNIPTVQEILFIDTQVMRIQLYRRETDYWTMRNFTHGDTLELSSLAVRFPVAEVYEKTTFDHTFAAEE